MAELANGYRLKLHLRDKRKTGFLSWQIGGRGFRLETRFLGDRIQGMNLINTHVTELAAGFAVIKAFISTLESTWLPGFERSYKRRTAEYLIALEKHEERGFFLRTLLKTPKRPNRPPLRYKEETAARMLNSWRASFTASAPAASTYAALHETLDNDFYALSDLQLQADLAAPFVIIGPPGIIVVSDGGVPEQPLQQTAVAIGELLRGSEFAAISINTNLVENWTVELAEIKPDQSLDQETVFPLTDILLARGQELTQSRTSSALSTAEKIAEQEKDNLLKMAATL